MSRMYLPVKRMSLVNEFPNPPAVGPRHDPADLDYNILSTITGGQVTAEDYGLQDGQPLGEEWQWVTPKDIENYEILRDLFWWYAKMDVYQSMLGGTKLL